jgi:hypothetical protein
VTIGDTLRVSFVFPGAPTTIEICLNREVGTGQNPNDKYKYDCDPAIELALSSVRGLNLASVFTRPSKNSFTTEFSLGFNRDDLCLDIAIALGAALEKDVVIGEVIDKRIGRTAYY